MDWTPDDVDRLFVEEIPPRYQPVGKLGAGGTYRVYRAKVKEPEGAPDVALKVLALSSDGADWDAVRFHERSQRILRGLQHAGIPALLDAFSTPRGQVLVTELVEGETLAELLASGRHRLDEKGSLALLAETAEILRYLHGLRPPIVHRDINPTNLLLTPDRRIKLIDFNAATDDPRIRLVGGQTQIGTVGYVPFEQYEGRASPASDIYALGATFVHLMTGVPPHELPRRDLVPDLTALYLSPGAAALLVDCLAVDPNRRPAAEQVIARVKALIAAPSAIAAPTPPTPLTKKPVGPSSRPGQLEELWQEAKQHPEDVERQRAFIRFTVTSNAHSVAIERYNQLLSEQPARAEAIAKYKREIAMQVAGKLLAKTANEQLALKQKSAIRNKAIYGGFAAVATLVMILLWYLQRTLLP